MTGQLLKDMNLKAGDMVKCISCLSGALNLDHKYIVEEDQQGLKLEGGPLKSWSSSRFVLVESGPITWGGMSDVDKGSLLLAVHNGEEVEFYNYISKVWYRTNNIEFHTHKAYRVKPAPVVVNHSRYVHGGGSWWTFFSDKSTHKISFETIDGVISCGSIKMEKL